MPEDDKGLPESGDKPPEDTNLQTPPEGEPGEPTGEPTGEPKPGEPEPRKFAGKYETIEALETAYVEAEKRMHQATEESAQYRAYIQQQLAERQRTKEPVTDPSQEIERFTKSPQEFIDQRVQEQLGATQEQLRMAQEATDFKVNHSDWEKVYPAMQEQLKLKPHLWNIPGRLEILYELAKGAEMAKGMADAQKDAYQQGEKSAAGKDQLKQGTPTSKSKAGAEPQKSEDEMTSDEFAKAHDIKTGPDGADKPLIT